jgi:hypothetical protein
MSEIQIWSELIKELGALGALLAVFGIAAWRMGPAVTKFLTTQLDILQAIQKSIATMSEAVGKLDQRLQHIESGVGELRDDVEDLYGRRSSSRRVPKAAATTGE